MPELISLTLILTIFKVLGGVTTLVSLAYGVFKVITWIKNKFTSIDENVVALKTSMDTHITGLREDIKSQTTTIASALSEQRADFRTFYAPTLLMLQQQSAQQLIPVRAKRPARKPARKK